jgi:hypothetical protein
MGILDEAIREHLDLKRRQGTGDAEIQRLEDEAFGPPSRPGDPDFPEQEPDAEQGTAEADQVSTDSGALPAEASSEETAVPPTDVEAPPSAEEPVALPQTDESDGSGFFDAEAEEAEEDLDSGLELEVDKEIEDVGEIEVEQEPAEAPGEDAPSISQVDTVEHHFEGAIDEAEVVEDEPSADQSGSTEPDADEAAENEEDVLEETPEFLQDTPEDDELWFEQGEPKDFDF